MFTHEPTARPRPTQPVARADTQQSGLTNELRRTAHGAADDDGLTIPLAPAADRGVSLEAKGLLVELLLLAQADNATTEACESLRRARSMSKQRMSRLLGELQRAGYVSLDREVSR